MTEIDTALGGNNFYDMRVRGELPRTTYRPSPAGTGYNVDLTLHPLCVSCQSLDSSPVTTVVTKNMYFSFPYCATTNYVTDHTTSHTNSYELISVAPHVYNLIGLQAADPTNCPIHKVEVEFVDYANLAAVPGLTETANEFCENRASSTNCDGSSDFYLKWVFTQEYLATPLKIKLKATMVNSKEHTS